jgi:GDP/UDP-N,N'-diacetylbacillosamine 2-epimerase (hydrolysing)
VGNSSSGLAEVPTFKIGTVNIGDRQKGRLKAKSIIDCDPTKTSIKKAIEILYTKNYQKILPIVENPYGKGEATLKIMEVLRKTNIPEETKKIFYDL